ncbi:phosphoribosylformylglycinamidine synthase [Coemansia sp. RSA 2705]|nr:phosphoribosylformylglycinamidine synthase [Coemansia sp. RSA 2705]
MLIREFLFLVGTIARIQTHNVHFVDLAPVHTEIVQFYATALSKHMPAVAEVLLPTAPENARTIIATLLHAPGESSAPQATIKRPLREAPIHDSADGDELARPIRNIKAAQLQGIAEQNEGMTINVLARTNHELGLVVATDEIAYLIDAYLGAQAVDAGVARNPTDVGLMMFAQVNS